MGGVGQGGGQGGVDGGGTREQCGSNNGSTFFGSLKNLLIWLVTRGGGVGQVGQGGGQGGVDGGGAPVWEQQGVHWFHLLGSLKNLTIGLIWLVTRGGGVAGVGQGSRARGGRWGGVTREQCGSNKGVHWFHVLGFP